MRMFLLTSDNGRDGPVFCVVRAQTETQALYIGRSSEGRKHLDTPPAEIMAHELPIGGQPQIVWYSWTRTEAPAEVAPDMPTLPPVIEEHPAGEATLIITSDDITRYGVQKAEELARERRAHGG